MLNTITNPPIAKPIMAYDQILTVCRYSGAKKSEYIPYLPAIDLLTKPNKIIQISNNR